MIPHSFSPAIVPWVNIRLFSPDYLESSPGVKDTALNCFASRLLARIRFRSHFLLIPLLGVIFQRHVFFHCYADDTQVLLIPGDPRSSCNSGKVPQGCEPLDSAHIFPTYRFKTKPPGFAPPTKTTISRGLARCYSTYFCS